MPYEGVDGSDYINANYIDVSCDQFHLWRLNDTIPKTLLLAVLTVWLYATHTPYNVCLTTLYWEHTVSLTINLSFFSCAYRATRRRMLLSLLKVLCQTPLKISGGWYGSRRLIPLWCWPILWKRLGYDKLCHTCTKLKCHYCSVGQMPPVLASSWDCVLW